MTAASVRDATRAMLATIDRGRAGLRRLGLPYPGGDVCPRDVVRGIDSLLSRFDELDGYTDEERAALQWLGLWRDAGRAML